MLNFLFQLFMSSPIRMTEAANALHTPPLTSAARRYLLISLGCLMAGASLLVAAATVGWSAGLRAPLVDGLGWPGLGLLIVSIYNGLRYKVVNLGAFEEMLADGGYAEELSRLSAGELSAFWELRQSDRAWLGIEEE